MINTPAADVASAAIRELQSALGEASVLTDGTVAGRMTSDWSEAEAAPPTAIVLPRTPAEVATALRILHSHHKAVAVQGGLTGLAGGANPQPGEIALSLSRLDRIEDLDAIGGTAIVEAGVTLERLQAAAAETGWFFPLDLGARGSCQLGGNAATNAGGNRVLRFGMMRNLVLGLEVALPDGTLLTMLDRVIKNNAGFDLKHLFIGSEGTLGVVTRLALQLVPRPLHQPTALCAVPDFVSALALLRASKCRLPGLTAFELMWRDFFEASCDAQKKASPFEQSHPLYVLIEGFAASEELGNASIEQLLAHAIEEGLVTDAVIAQSVSQTSQLWAYREGVGELLSLCKPLAAFDVSVSAPRMDELVANLRARLSEAFPSQRHLFFGHLGDGNLHLISGNFLRHDDVVRAEEMVYATVGAFDGSISAEHGVGMIKRPFLHHSRSEAEVRLMRQLKGMLDPRNILNPGRVIG